MFPFWMQEMPNIPPLEAWQLEKPLIYSKNLAEQAASAARLIDPDDADSLAESMLEVQSNEYSSQLVASGLERLKEINSQRISAEADLTAALAEFSKRTLTWK